MDIHELQVSLSRARHIAARMTEEFPPPNDTPLTLVAQQEVRTLVTHFGGPKIPSTSYVAPNKPAQIAHWSVVTGDVMEKDVTEGDLFHLVLRDDIVDENGEVGKLTVLFDCDRI